MALFYWLRVQSLFFSSLLYCFDKSFKIVQMWEAIAHKRTCVRWRYGYGYGRGHESLSLLFIANGIYLSFYMTRAAVAIAQTYHYGHICFVVHYTKAAATTTALAACTWDFGWVMRLFNILFRPNYLSLSHFQSLSVKLTNPNYKPLEWWSK